MVKILEKDTEALSRIFGFRSKEDFIRDAVKEKVMRLKSLLFSRTAEKVRRGLEQKGTTEEKVLRDFELLRRS